MEAVTRGRREAGIMVGAGTVGAGAAFYQQTLNLSSLGPSGERGELYYTRLITVWKNK